MATTSAGAIGVTLQADTAQFDSSADKSAAIAERSMQRTSRAQQTAAKDADRLVQSIQRQVDSFGLTGTALLRYEARLKGVSDQANPLIDRLEKMKDAQAAFANEANKTSNLGKGFAEVEAAAGRAAHGTAGITRELLVLGHEASQGNWKRFGGSLLVLGEFAAPLIAGMGAALAPILAVVAAVGSFVAGIAVGASETKEFNNALRLTGNAAGITAGQMDAMSRSIAGSTNTGIGKARTAIEELVKTGEVGPALIGPMATATVQLEKLTGQSSEEIVKDFAKMGDGVAKWAAEHNKQLNFISGDQYAYIKRLEDMGQKEAAEAETLRLLNDHIKDLHPSLGFLQSAWKGVGDWASYAWDSMKGVGRADTVDQRLERAKEQVSNLRKAIEDENSGGKFGVATSGRADRLKKLLEGAMSNEGIAEDDQRMERRSASASAEQAALEKRRIAAIESRDHWREETKGIALVNKELEKYRTLTVEPLKGTDNAISAEEQAKAEAAIRKKYDPQGSQASKQLDSRFEDRKVALIQEGIRLDAEAKSWDAYGKSIDKARLSVLNVELEQGKLGKLSEARKIELRSLAAADDAKDKILAESQARAKAGEEVEKYVSKLRDETAQKAMYARETELATGLAYIDARAAHMTSEAYVEQREALRTWITVKHDQLLVNKLAVDSEVANIREEISLLGASTLARQISTEARKRELQAKTLIAANPGQESVILKQLADDNLQVAAAIIDRYNAERTAQAGSERFFKKYSEEATDASKTIESLSSTAVGDLENSLSGIFSNTKLNVHSMVDSMINEVLRLTVIKPLLADIFGTSGTNGSASQGIGGIFGSILKVFGGSSAASGGQASGATLANIGNAGMENYLAVGTNYVPYDGMKAVLHKGEAVIPAAYNPAAGGRGMSGGGTTIVNVTATPGMSRASAVQQGRDIGDGLAIARGRNG